MIIKQQYYTDHSSIINNMPIKHCDLCEEKIEGYPIMVGKLWHGAELCQDCAEPVIAFLKKHNLIEKSGLKDLQAKAIAV